MIDLNTQGHDYKAPKGRNINSRGLHPRYKGSQTCFGEIFAFFAKIMTKRIN